MAYELLLADADGTLFDFDAGEQNALTELFAHFDIPVREENFQTYHRINREQWALLEQGRTTLPELQVARMANFLAAVGLRRSPEEMHLYFRDRLSCQSILLPGAEAFCARVAEKMPICLVTNGVAVIQHARFDRCPISPYLSGLFISEELGAAKPDPAIVHAALRRMGVAPENAVMIGDSAAADIPAANAAGVFSILFTNGRSAPENHGANAVAASYEEAERLIFG